MSRPPECKLPELPPHLFAKRINSESENAFLNKLSEMQGHIMADCPEAQRNEHASKTYTLVATMHEKLRATGFGQDDDFFVLGQYRGEEKARAHMHSSVPMVLDISQLADYLLAAPSRTPSRASSRGGGTPGAAAGASPPPVGSAAGSGVLRPTAGWK